MTSPDHWLRVGLSFIAAAVWSCQPPERADQGDVAERRATGVREEDREQHELVPWLSGDPWTIADEPTLRIGEATGEAPYQLFRVRDATVAEDGSVLVGNEGTGEVRAYGPDGTFWWSAGGVGGGPGEFMSIRSIEVNGDTISVFDDRLGRMTLLGLDGELLDVIQTLPQVGEGRRRTADMRPVAEAYIEIEVGIPIRSVSGTMTRDTLAFLHLDRSSGERRLLLRTPGPRILHFTLGGQAVFRPQPLTPNADWDARADRLYIIPGEFFEIIVIDGTDGTVREVRREGDLLPVGEHHARAWETALLGGASARRRAEVAPLLESMTFPGFLPAYGAVRVGPSGDIWAGPYVPPGMPSEVWDVYNSEGDFLGEVRSPHGLEVLEIGADFVMGRWIDNSDVEYIRIHTLDRGGAWR